MRDVLEDFFHHVHAQIAIDEFAPGQNGGGERHRPLGVVEIVCPEVVIVRHLGGIGGAGVRGEVGGFEAFIKFDIGGEAGFVQQGFADPEVFFVGDVAECGHIGRDRAIQFDLVRLVEMHDGGGGGCDLGA